jgi:sec-independent protein translocase protein TatC
MALNILNRAGAPLQMSFVDHLEALRWHIVRSFFAVVVIAIILFWKMDWFFDAIIMGPLRDNFISTRSLCTLGHALKMGDVLCLPPTKTILQTTSFSSQFISSISIAMIGGFIVAFPYIFWELWSFIKPALSKKEIRKFRGGILWVSVFFLLGVAFGYFLLSPFTFNFLSNYSLGTTHQIQTRPTLDDYLENLTDVAVGSGLAFQLPLVSYVLTGIGLISPALLRGYRRYAYVAILFLAAIITPSPDWMSQAIVSLPLILLYELSIRVSARVVKQQRTE